MEGAMIETMIEALIESTLVTATPIILAVLGLTFAERSGVLNVGMEGIMLMSASTGFTVAAITGSLAMGLVAALIMGIALGGIIAFLSISLCVDQVILGIGIWFLGLSLSNYIWWSIIFNTRGVVYLTPFPRLSIPFVSDIPIIGVIGEQNWMVYAALILVFVTYFVLNKTVFGLRVSGVGQNPMGADLIGVRVFLLRYVCVIICGFFAGLAGSFFTLGQTGSWTNNITAGDGWIAIAMVRLGRWNPFWGTVGALIFGFFIKIQFILQLSISGLPYEVFLALPYTIGIIILVISSKFKGAEPKSLGIPYRRGAEH